MQTVADLTLDALRDGGRGSLPCYAAALRNACAAHPPPFGMDWYGERYRSLALDVQWLAGSLIANAQKEADGSRQLWALSGRIADETTAELVRRHALDESRHARLYIAMLEAAFPDAVEPALGRELHALSPGYRPSESPERSPAAEPEHVLDEIIQMNLGEIRTRIHQLLLRPVLAAACAPSAIEQVSRILDLLLRDETEHIAYTARLIDSKAASPEWVDFVSATMDLRLKEFNEITLAEVGESRFVGE